MDPTLVASSQKQGWLYGTVRLIFGTVRFFCNGTGTATLQKLSRSTVPWYGTVEGARYVVRKF